MVRNAADTGDATLILDSNAQNGVVELKALAGGGVQMNTIFQFMSFNTTNGLANLAIEPNIGGSNNGELIFGYGFVNLSDKALKTNVRDLSEKELQETFDAVEPRMYDRIEGGQGPDRLHRPGGAGHPSGREGLQDQEPGRQRTHDARLPEAQRGPLGRGEVPAEASGEPREEEARPLLKNGGAGGDRAPRATGPGLQRARPQEAPADSPAGVPGPADLTAERRGRTSGSRRTWWTSRRTCGAPTGTGWW